MRLLGTIGKHRIREVKYTWSHGDTADFLMSNNYSK